MEKSGRVCQTVVADGKICGLQIGGGSARACKLHANTGNITSIIDTKEYLQENTRDYIDLTRLRFTGVFFDKSLFSPDKPVKFDGTEFINCTFDQCSFFNASFGILERRCRFENSQFQGCWFQGAKCSFHSAEFVCEKTVFSGCMFMLEIEDAKRTTTIDFSECTAIISREMFHLSYAQCYALKMEETTVDGGSLTLFVYDAKNDIQQGLGLSLNGARRISFLGLHFNGRFVYRQSPDFGRYGPILFLSGINFAEMASAQFLHANLKVASFTNSNIETIKFHNPEWPREEGRLILYNQIESDSRTDISADDIKELTRLYVQLKKNYELDRNFIDAGDWFYCEMESRRKLIALQSTGVWRWLRQHLLSPYPWYKRVSSYGESYAKAAGWLIALLVVFGFVYCLFGSQTCDPPIDASIVCSLAYSLSVMTLQFNRMYENIDTVTYVISITQLLLTAIVIPLFLLALRRKFRR